VLKPVIAYEDNAVRWAFSTYDIAGSAIPPVLVKPWQIGVLRIGKTNFVFWTIPLVAPATDEPNPTPEVVIPPGMLVLRGYGEPISGHAGPLPVGPNGWILETDGSYYLASATLLCPRWRYCGPVAEEFE
jgi:hypothetical protein